MHQIYAIEPESLCDSWERFDRIFIEGMGYDKGRVMAILPRLKNWMRDAKRNSSLDQMGPVKSKSIKEKYLRRDGNEFIKRTSPVSYSNAESGATWLEKAEVIHEKEPFKAIIAQNNPKNHPAVLRYEDIGGECAPWSVPSSGRILRNLSAISECKELLLKQSIKVSFIDPYFCFDPRFLNVLKRNLEYLRDSPQTIESIEFNCAYNPLVWTQDQQDTFLHNLTHSIRNQKDQYLPNDSDDLAKVMSFKVWKNTTQARVHPRLILTDIGGLNIESGLDTATELESRTPVSRISGVELLEWWAEYTEGTSPFNLLEEISVIEDQ